MRPSVPLATGVDSREIVEQKKRPMKAEDERLELKRCLESLLQGLGFGKVETVDSAEVAVIVVQHPTHVEDRHCYVVGNDSHWSPSVLLRDLARSSGRRLE